VEYQPFVVGATCDGHLSAMGRIRLFWAKRDATKLLLVLVTTDPVFVARVERKVYIYYTV
jgi:predicted ABC-type transport system involved in lysophospholipase L1 biosynthesis ATPase subunit